MTRTNQTTTDYPGELLPDEHWWMEGRARALERALLRFVPLGGPALDAGAGNGLWGSRLALKFAPTILVEPDAELGAKTRKARGSMSVVRASLPGPFPFGSSTFGLVTCLDVIEHVPDDQSSVLELVRLAKPGGYILVTVPAHPHLWSKLDEEVGHQRRYTKEALSAVISRAGAEILLLDPLNVWLYPAAALMRRMNKVGDAMPAQRINRLLSSFFGSEGNMLGHWPSFMKGLSWVCLAQKPH